jgi:hypothetical protein
MTQAKASCDLIAFQATVTDPSDVVPANQAYCVLVEIHMHLVQQAVVAIIHCWRSREAFLSRCEPFSRIPVTIKTEDGGTRFFQEQGIDGARGQLGPHLVRLCASLNGNIFGAVQFFDND